MIGAAGLEPARACARQPLKLARLPVPPRPDVINCCYGRAPWLRTEAYRTKSVSHLGASAQVDAPFSFV